MKTIWDKRAIWEQKGLLLWEERKSVKVVKTVTQREECDQMSNMASVQFTGELKTWSSVARHLLWQNETVNILQYNLSLVLNEEDSYDL